MDPDQKVVYSVVKKFVEESRKEGARPCLLAESLGLRGREIVSLVGAGGKTTLMFRLARELLLAGEKVVTTTTTKIMEPSSGETAFLLIDLDEKKLKQFALRHLLRHHHITIASERLESGKLKGISSALVDELWGSQEINKIIVEADGAARRPVKAPREGEPVIPSSTTFVVAMLGVDGVGMELKKENVFQAERISKITRISMGEKITDEAMAILMTHPEGIFKGAPSSSRVVAFINKVDIPNGLVKGRRVAEKILERKHPQIERVVLGQLENETSVAEVIFPSNKVR